MHAPGPHTSLDAATHHHLPACLPLPLRLHLQDPALLQLQLEQCQAASAAKDEALADLQVQLEDSQSAGEANDAQLADLAAQLDSLREQLEEAQGAAAAAQQAASDSQAAQQELEAQLAAAQQQLGEAQETAAAAAAAAEQQLQEAQQEAAQAGDLAASRLAEVGGLEVQLAASQADLLDASSQVAGSASTIAELEEKVRQGRMKWRLPGMHAACASEGPRSRTCHAQGQPACLPICWGPQRPSHSAPCLRCCRAAGRQRRRALRLHHRRSGSSAQGPDLLLPAGSCQCHRCRPRRRPRSGTGQHAGVPGRAAGCSGCQRQVGAARVPGVMALVRVLDACCRRAQDRHGICAFSMLMCCANCLPA